MRVENSNGVSSLPSETLMVEVPYDSAGDGLPDWWAIKHFADLDEDRGGDFDGDGISNGIERDSDTDPSVVNTGDIDQDSAFDTEEGTAGANPFWRDHPAVQLTTAAFANVQ